MGDDGTDVHVPGAGDFWSTIEKVPAWIIDHPTPSAAGFLAITAMIFYKKNKILSIGLICLMLGILGTRMYLSMN